MGAEVLKPLDWHPELVQAFEPAALVSPWGPFEVGHLLNGAYAFEYKKENQRALLALRMTPRESGQCVELVAMVSTGDRLQAAHLADSLQCVARASGATLLAMATASPHIVASCKRMGWNESGTVMLKKIGGLQ